MKTYDILNGFRTVINEVEAVSEDDAIATYAVCVNVPLQKLLDAGYSARLSSFQKPKQRTVPQK